MAVLEAANGFHHVVLLFSSLGNFLKSALWWGGHFGIFVLYLKGLWGSELEGGRREGGKAWGSRAPEWGDCRIQTHRPDLVRDITLIYFNARADDLEIPREGHVSTPEAGIQELCPASRPDWQRSQHEADAGPRPCIKPQGLDRVAPKRG